MHWQDAPVTTEIDPERKRHPADAQFNRSHGDNIFDWHLGPNLIKVLNQQGFGPKLHIEEDPTANLSPPGDSDDEPDLKAAASPQTLFNTSESINEFANKFPDSAYKSISIHYYLQCDEGVKARIAGLDQRCNDIRGLMSDKHKHPKRVWHSNLRDILSGLLVIDCFSRQVVVADPDCTYVALSYVWGPDGHDGDKRVFRTDLRGRRLPRTIRDAMNVVRVLGMKYLWVDRYCIDNTEPGTKHHMISNMDAIYEAAYLTIIAASGSHSDQGLPSVSRTFRALDEGTTPPWDGIVYSEFSQPQHEQFKNSTYSTRGWTFQEDLLSQRRLIFTIDRATLYNRG